MTKSLGDGFLTDFPSCNDDDSDAFLRECMDGNNGKAASESKVCVLSFQCTLPGTTPYYTLVGWPQTTNKAICFGDEVVKACLQASNEDGSAVLLNTTTDGVSVEVPWIDSQGHL